MAISVKCRACGAAFAVKDELGGKKIRCVRCKEVIAVASNTNIVGGRLSTVGKADSASGDNHNGK